MSGASTAEVGRATAGTLQLDGISRAFGNGTPAVDALSLEIRRGELLALVGASGSGKTTTLRMVAGYERPDRGRLLLDGTDITTLPPEKRGFGMVFQHYALFPHLTVVENVAFGLEARRVAKAERLARAQEALAAVGLPQYGARAVQALSGGEQQRVALARALVIEPPVLLLDEPLSNLDPLLRVAMRDELRDLLRRRQVTALFVTHDQEDAFAVADRVALLEHGVLLQVDRPEALYHHPANRRVAMFIGRSTLVPASLLEGGRARVTRCERSVEFAAAQPAGASAPTWLAVLRPEHLQFAPLDAPTAWPAEITARRFAGASFHYAVRLADGTTLEVSGDTGAHALGDRVGVQLMPQGAVALVPA